MVGFGIPQPEIARLINISDRTLRTYYRRELDTGATEANVRVAQSIYNMATKGENVTAAIWWTKCRMGWREPPRDVNVGGQQDNPLAIDFTWAPALPTPLPASEPPTIEAETTEDAEAGDVVVVWGGQK
jgi:hypothetical protein